MNIPYQSAKKVINCRRGISLGKALRLAKVFEVSADFFMKNQKKKKDVYFATRLNHMQPIILLHFHYAIDHHFERLEVWSVAKP